VWVEAKQESEHLEPPRARRTQHGDSLRVRALDMRCHPWLPRWLVSARRAPAPPLFIVAIIAPVTLP
jgi:hypothetical protein